MNKSLWMEDYNIEVNNKEILDNVDVLIIGGGLTGIMTAYELRNDNLKIALVTSDRIGTHTSSKTTAKISAIHNLLYQDIYKTHGLEKATKYFKAQKEAISNIINIINTEKINCDLEAVDNYVFADTLDGLKKIEAEESIYNEIGIDVVKTDNIPIKKNIKKALKYEGDYIFNPVKYMNSIIKIIDNKGIYLYEGYTALDYTKSSNGYIINLSNDKFINAKHVVIATHYPIFNVPGLYFTKLYQEKSYLISFRSKKEIEGIYINTDLPVRSLRYDSKGNIIMVGNSHIAGETINYKEEIKSLIKSVFEFDEYASILNIWTNQDVMSIDYLPFIGRYSRITPNMYVATSFQTWGMTNSHIASKLISDMIRNIDNEYISLFNPLRFSYLKSIKESYKMIKRSVNGLIISKFNKKITLKQIKKFDGAIVRYKGKKYAVYNNSGKNIILKTNCTHLNCSLQWNNLEKTWDCKCHGSRYDIYGNVKEGPATSPLKRLKV